MSFAFERTTKIPVITYVAELVEAAMLLMQVQWLPFLAHSRGPSLDPGQTAQNGSPGGRGGFLRV